jgi:hypothetical protein
MDIKSFKSFNENSENVNYMFFANLQHICRMASEMLEMDESQIDDMLTDGHDWANDHISKSMESISHVYNFLHASDLDKEEIQSQFEDETFEDEQETQFEDEQETQFEDEQETQFEEPIEEEPIIEESVKSFKDFK